MAVVSSNSVVGKVSVMTHWNVGLVVRLLRQVSVTVTVVPAGPLVGDMALLRVEAGAPRVQLVLAVCAGALVADTVAVLVPDPILAWE